MCSIGGVQLNPFKSGGLQNDLLIAGAYELGGLGGAGAAAGGEAAGAAASMPAAIAEADATFGGALTQTAPGVFEAAAPAGAGAIGAAGALEGATSTAPPSGMSILSASSPTLGLDPATAAALGIESSVLPTGAVESASGMMAGGAPTFGENAFGGGYLGEPTGQWGGATGMDAAGGAGALDATTAWLKKLGLTPATAGLLGISGLQALSKPKLPEAAKDLQRTGAAGAQAATGVIQSGGTSGPAWATQKASIDATIDQQLKEQTAAMLQQAVNSGQGADSQVTLQQINKLKNQLETSRQQMYEQAQAQNVQAALRQLGISDQALAQVANTQFQQSAQARQGAAQTASLAIMLSALGKG